MLLENPAVWALAGIALLIVEFFTLSTILVFFGVAALLVALFTVTGALTTFMGQVITFAIVSVVLLLFLRQKFAAIFRGNRVSRGSHDDSGMIGREGVVTRAFVNGCGAVRIGGTSWEARAVENLPEGQAVEVIGHEAVVLIVEPIGNL